MKTKPARVPGRSREFQDYLDRQSPADRLSIERGEAAYLTSLQHRLHFAEVLFAEQMTGAIENPPSRDLIVSTLKGLT